MFNLFFGYNSTFPLLCLGRDKYFHQFNIVVIKICYFTINSPAEFKGFPDTLYKFPWTFILPMVLLLYTIFYALVLWIILPFAQLVASCSFLGW